MSIDIFKIRLVQWQRFSEVHGFNMDDLKAFSAWNAAQNLLNELSK